MKDHTRGAMDKIISAGKKLLRKKQYEDALDQFTNVITAGADNAEAFLYSGICRFEMGDYFGSIEDYDKAAELNGIGDEIYVHRGKSYYNLEDYNTAIDDFKKAIDFNPKSAEAYCMLGLCKNGFMNFEEAMEDFDQAIEIDSKYAEAYLGRGMTKLILNYDKKSACDDIKKAASLGMSKAKEIKKQLCK